MNMLELTIMAGIVKRFSDVVRERLSPASVI